MTIQEEVAELLAEWPDTWNRDGLNFLVCAAKRLYDDDPAVAVHLRYSYTPVATALMPLETRWIDGKRACGARLQDVEDAIAETSRLLGQSLDVQNNCPSRIFGDRPGHA